VLGNAGYAGSVEEMSEVLAVAHALGLEVDRLEIRRAEDIAPAFEQLAGSRLSHCLEALDVRGANVLVRPILRH
jgi:hypothetical protein